MPQFAREFGLVLGGQHQPAWPVPILVGTAHAHVQNEPVHFTRTEVWRTQLVQLPRARDGEVAGAKFKIPPLNHEGHGACFQKVDFDAFIPVRIKPPVLCLICIPKADAVDARQLTGLERNARIMAFGERMQFDLAITHGRELRLAGNNPEARMFAPVNGVNGRTHVCSISFAERHRKTKRAFCMRFRSS